MADKVKAIPAGYHTVTPYLIIRDAASALAFYQKAFGATERMRFADPQGRVGHAEIKIGNSIIMLGEESPEMGARGPQTLGGSPVNLLLYVKDVDAAFSRALAAGAKELGPVKDQFYGDRIGSVTDPYGHVWYLATHKEDVSPDELQRRAAAAHGGQEASVPAVDSTQG